MKFFDFFFFGFDFIFTFWEVSNFFKMNFERKKKQILQPVQLQGKKNCLLFWEIIYGTAWHNCESFHFFFADGKILAVAANEVA